MKKTFIERLPNRITVFRMILIIFFIPLLLEGKNDERMLFSYLAFAIFVIASISDFLDGYIARKYKVESNFGRVMDPLADKILVFAALICFVWLRIVPAWMVIIIVSREFLISGIRIIAAKRGDIIGASNWGKAKTITEITAILVILLLIAAHNTFVHYGIKPPEIMGFSVDSVMLKIVPYWLMFLATVFALISGLEYFFKNKKIFEEEI
ncbi:MAG TPA: CDP-diacylglycerol--glycerol-3-phosphate 3-phosphatidyltransferase [bacterium]|nr:CDP-diacylglycerol--glycerol-3-phosphate 3-phosphatidyltransferase [bacterium]